MSIAQFKGRDTRHYQISYLIDVSSKHQRDSITILNHAGNDFHVLITLQSFDLDAMEHGRQQACQIIEQQLRDGTVSVESCRNYPLYRA